MVEAQHIEQQEPSANEIARMLRNYEARLKKVTGKRKLDPAAKDLFQEIDHFATTHADAIKLAVAAERADRKESYRRMVLWPSGIGMFTAIAFSLTSISKTLPLSSGSAVWGSAIACAIAVVIAASMNGIWWKKKTIERQVDKE